MRGHNAIVQGMNRHVDVPESVLPFAAKGKFVCVYAFGHLEYANAKETRWVEKWKNDFPFFCISKIVVVVVRWLIGWGREMRRGCAEYFAVQIRIGQDKRVIIQVTIMFTEDASKSFEVEEKLIVRDWCHKYPEK